MSLVLMFADSRFHYLSQVRYYAAMVTTPVHFLADLPGRGIDGFKGLFQTRLDLLAENARLEEELLMQRYQLQKLNHLTAENRRLNELLKASSIVDEVVVRVQLVGESPDPFVKRVRINKGSSEGVHVGQPVIDADGLMGQVAEVEPLSSWVLLITDPQHSTPVLVNRNGIRAIASGTRDSLHTLSLINIPNTADIQVGDQLVTSGLGQRFPAGYPVGVISSIVHDPGKPFADVLVTPTAQIDRSRNLLLIFGQQGEADPNLQAAPEPAEGPQTEGADAALGDPAANAAAQLVPAVPVQAPAAAPASASPTATGVN